MPTTYTCPICSNTFGSCGKFLAHKRKTGHASVRCTICSQYQPSKSAKKKHEKKEGHDTYDGTLIPAKFCKAGCFNQLQQWARSNGVAMSSLRAAKDGEMVSDLSSDDDEQKEEDNNQSSSMATTGRPFKMFCDSLKEEEDYVPSESPSPCVSTHSSPLLVARNIPEVAEALPELPPDPWMLYMPRYQKLLAEKERKAAEAQAKVEAEAEAERRRLMSAANEASSRAKKTKVSAREANRIAARARKADPTYQEQMKKKKKKSYNIAEKTSGDLGAVSFDLEFSYNYAAKLAHNLPLLEHLASSDTSFPPASPWLIQKMQAEWSGEEKQHWDYVHMPVPEEREERELVEGDNRDIGHIGMTLHGFLNLEEATKACLHLAEVIALRLYTGPGYSVINSSCRAEDGRFAVTCFTLESAIIKVAQTCRKCNSVRGIKGTMPQRFKDLYQEGKKLKRGDAIADPGFLSTSAKETIATDKSAYGGDTLFIIRGKAPRPGLLRTGAVVSWISQFPEEEEVLYPQYTELWYCLPEKRDHTKRYSHLKKDVFEFNARHPFNGDLNCPDIPGYGGTS